MQTQPFTPGAVVSRDGDDGYASGVSWGAIFAGAAAAAAPAKMAPQAVSYTHLTLPTKA